MKGIKLFYVVIEYENKYEINMKIKSFHFMKMKSCYENKIV